MAGNEAFYRWLKSEAVSAANLTRRFIDLHLRLVSLESLKVSYEDVLATVSDRVLQRSEDVIAGLRSQLAQITQLEWLTALSTTSLTLVEGQVRSLVVLAEQRALFAPGPYALLTRTTTPDVYAIVRPLNYDRATGQLDFEVVTAVGGAGPFADWQIAALAGSTLAQMSLLGVGKAARDLAIAARDRAETAAAQVASDKLIIGMNKAAAEQAASTAATKASEAAASADRAATFDPSNYYPKAAVDQKVADLKGTADAAHDTLGELAALVDAAAAAAATAAAVAAANTDAIARRHSYGNVRGLR